MVIENVQGARPRVTRACLNTVNALHVSSFQIRAAEWKVGFKKTLSYGTAWMLPNAFNRRRGTTWNDATREGHKRKIRARGKRGRLREEESVSPSSPFGKYDTTLEAASRPLAIYGNGSANGAWSQSCFTIFVQSKKRKKSICFFFSPQRNDDGMADGSTERVVAGEEKEKERMEEQRALLYFVQAACPFEYASPRGKSYATSTAREVETSFTLFPRRPRFYVRFVTFHRTPTATNSCQMPMNVWWRRSFAARRECAFSWRG